MPANMTAWNTAEIADLDEQTLQRVDGWWRAANYLSVGQIYLLRNPLLRTPLSADDVKPRLLGHWGTTPGLNFLYAHLNRAISQRRQSTIYLTGPGHGGPGLVANSYLDGTYSGSTPTSARTTRGCAGCSASSPSPAASRRTSRPRCPAPSTRAANSATPCRTPTAPRSTIRTCWSRPSSATARPRPARWPPAGIRTS